MAELLPLIYGELRALAASRLAREMPGQTLQATDLAHEVYLRLGASAQANWVNKAHYFAAAAEAMRRILIDRARSRGALKRGGGLRKLSLDAATLDIESPPAELLDIEQALEKLATLDPAKTQLVKLRFYAGLTTAEAAAILDISVATAERHWAFARAWMFKELGGDWMSEGLDRPLMHCEMASVFDRTEESQLAGVSCFPSVLKNSFTPHARWTTQRGRRFFWPRFRMMSRCGGS